LIGPYSSSGTAVATLKTRTAAATGFAGPFVAKSTPPSPSASLPAPSTAGVTHKTIRKPKVGKAPKSPVAATDVTTGTVAAETWQPDKDNLAGKSWSTGRAVSNDEVAPLRAPAGTTALSGRVLTLDDKPLANVTVSVEGVTAFTDAHGQFLLAGIKPGHRVLRVDGASASSPGRTFGLHDIGVDVAAKQTTVLPYTIWLSKLDTAHTVKFASPTKGEVPAWRSSCRPAPSCGT
jgi:hypothetical protein